MADERALAFRFRPRYRVLPWATVAVGVAFLGVAAIFRPEGAALAAAIGGGAAAVLLGLAYQAAPAWRFRVVVTDDELAVWHGDELRFRVAWPDIARVIASPSTHTCFVDGGTPARSLLVPGPGAPAPYRIEGREALFAEILRRAPKQCVVEVGSLDEKKEGV